jgi:ABC-2 type transport system permease protein
MLKRELKINLKSFIIWTTVVAGILLMAFLVYPSMASKTGELDALLKTFPEELLKAFSMDLVSIGSVSGWFATEGYMMVTLIGSAYASLMGGSILLKEESDKTIEYLYSKPISRNKIVTAKILTGLLYILLFNLAISLLSLINFYISDDLNQTRWFIMSIAPLFMHYLFFFLSMFISTFFKKLKSMTGISLGLSLGTYFIHVISLMSDKIEFLKYITPYEYFSSRYIIINEKLNLGYLILTIILILVFTLGTYYRYNKKELTV